MKTLTEIEACVEREGSEGSVVARARELLNFGEDVLEHWIVAKSLAPTFDEVEGFRLLALHRQGAKGDGSFIACRESCRELAYHYNLLSLEPDHPDTSRRLVNMRLLARHIYYFVSGKMQSAQLGEFCCSSRAVRRGDPS